MRPLRPVLIVMASALLVAGACACAPRELLRETSVRPAIISPNADGKDDIAEIKYTLTRQSTVDIYLLDAAGARHDLRSAQRRSPGPRTAYFGGVIDQRLLPDGDYRLVIEATDDRGRREARELSLTLVDGDPVPLEISHLSIWPKSFTPNRDGITDRVTIGYDLSKEASRVSVYLLDAAGNRYPVPEDQIREMGAPGTHEHDYDAGVDLGANPPPDGIYTVIVEAEDLVGNAARVQGELEISGGGVPQVEIIKRAAAFSPTVIPLHGTLYFTCTVKNVGRVPVRTKGPESGTLYSTSENFNTLGAFEEPGIFRVGLDYEGNSSGRSYPFRWQLGADAELTRMDTPVGPQLYLMPGQSVMVHGQLRIDDQPYKIAPYYWLGLVHEQVRVVQDQVEPTQISIGF